MKWVLLSLFGRVILQLVNWWLKRNEKNEKVKKEALESLLEGNKKDDAQKILDAFDSVNN